MRTLGQRQKKAAGPPTFWRLHQFVCWQHQRHERDKTTVTRIGPKPVTVAIFGVQNIFETTTVTDPGSHIHKHLILCVGPTCSGGSPNIWRPCTHGHADLRSAYTRVLATPGARIRKLRRQVQKQHKGIASFRRETQAWHGETIHIYPCFTRGPCLLHSRTLLSLYATQPKESKPGPIRPCVLLSPDFLHEAKQKTKTLKVPSYFTKQKRTGGVNHMWLF